MILCSVEIGDTAHAKESREMMKKLREDRLPQHLPESNVTEYELKWDSEGDSSADELNYSIACTLT